MLVGENDPQDLGGLVAAVRRRPPKRVIQTEVPVRAGVEAHRVHQRPDQRDAQATLEVEAVGVGDRWVLRQLLGIEPRSRVGDAHLQPLRALPRP